MKYKKFIRYYSFSRIVRYHKATGKRKDKTMMLYYANLKIAQTFHPLLGILEVILRNRLHSELAKYFKDSDWIINQKKDFMIDSRLSRENKKTKKIITNDYLLKEVVKSEYKLKKNNIKFTSERILAEQTLGFWVSLFDPIHYTILKGVPCQIFHKLPKQYGRKKIFTILSEIRDFRNRINHNEPICFSGNNIDFTHAINMYHSIMNLLEWIDPEIVISLKELDKVKDTIKKEIKKQS